MQRDGDSPLNVEIQVEINLCSRKLHFGAKEMGTGMEIHVCSWNLHFEANETGTEMKIHH